MILPPSDALVPQTLLSSLDQLKSILKRLNRLQIRLKEVEDSIERLESFETHSDNLLPLDVLALLELPENAHTVAMTLLQTIEMTEEEMQKSTGIADNIIKEALKLLIKNRYVGCRKEGERVSYFVANIEC